MLVSRRLAVASAALLAGMAVPVAAAATSPRTQPCPSASVVNAALGQKGKTPVARTTTFSKSCTYPGSGLVPTKITFQVDTATTFAAGEKAAGGTIARLSGLGQGAWVGKTGGIIDVFNGQESIKIVSPGTTTAKLEALEKKLL
jgi:hypothetical protein